MGTVDRSEALARVARAPSGHLGTVRPDGHPHVVVVTFALLDDDVVTAIDHKPKKTHRLQRLINIEHHPAASFLVDHYENDWKRLWWVRIDGAAVILESGTRRDAAVAALQLKYRQYHDRPPDGPVISVGVDRVTGWAGDT